MRAHGPAVTHVLTHPGAFAMQTLKGFRANQGLLLAGAVAYYTLLSIVPLLILIVIALGLFSQAPAGEREGAYALGATRWGMIRSVVLPGSNSCRREWR